MKTLETYKDGAQMLRLTNGDTILVNSKVPNGWHFSDEFKQFEYWYNGYRWAWLSQHGEMAQDRYWTCVCDSLEIYKSDWNVKPFAEAVVTIERFVEKYAPRVEIK